ncbi:MAG: hypothetical protein PHE50_01210 [Dehalococcoidales bacterium]|nr:hypothetical protein [Dehalococcoidales bacterium]
MQGDLLEPLTAPVNIIAANLPYVLTGDLVAVNTNGYEPRLALDGGKDGLDLIKKLVVQSKNKIMPGGCVLLEIGLGQKEPLQRFLESHNIANEVTFDSDLSGIERVVSLRY